MTVDECDPHHATRDARTEAIVWLARIRRAVRWSWALTIGATIAFVSFAYLDGTRHLSRWWLVVPMLAGYCTQRSFAYRAQAKIARMQWNDILHTLEVIDAAHEKYLGEQG